MCVVKARYFMVSTSAAAVAIADDASFFFILEWTVNNVRFIDVEYTCVFHGAISTLIDFDAPLLLYILGGRHATRIFQVVTRISSSSSQLGMSCAGPDYTRKFTSSRYNRRNITKIGFVSYVLMSSKRRWCFAAARRRSSAPCRTTSECLLPFFISCPLKARSAGSKTHHRS